MAAKRRRSTARALRPATIVRRPEPRHTSAARRLARLVRRRALWFAAALVLLHLILAAISFVHTPHTGGDNASYVALARSLLERHAYLELYDPAAPPHTQYPPVFPGIIALTLAAGLQPWFGIKVLIAVFSAAAIAFTFLWILRRRRPLLALGVGLVLAVSPGVLELAHWELSDVPFWTFTAVALLGFERLGRKGRARLALAVLAVTLAYFTRSAGLPLAIAAFGWLTLRRRWPQLATLAAVLVPLAFLWWLRARTQGGVDYVGQFWSVDPYDPSQGRIGSADLFARATDNLDRYARIHLPMLIGGQRAGALTALGLAAAGLGAYGWALRMRRPGIAELFLPLYLALLLLWPAVWSGERFLLPAFPLLLLYAGEGLTRLVRRVNPAAILPAGAVATTAIIVAGLPGLSLQIQRGTECGALYRAGDPYPCLSPAWRDFFDTAAWARQRLPDDAVIVSRKPRLFWGLSGHTGIIFPFVAEADTFFVAAAHAGGRYLVLDYVDGLSQAYVAPIVIRRPAAFCLMHVGDLAGTAVLGILTDARTMPDLDTAAPDVGFHVCGAEFWRDPADRETLRQRLGR